MIKMINAETGAIIVSNMAVYAFRYVTSIGVKLQWRQGTSSALRALYLLIQP